jgi:hypothetical protein
MPGGETGKKNGRKDTVLLEDARRCHCCERRGKGREERPEEVMWKLSSQAFHPAPPIDGLLSSGSHCFAHSSCVVDSPSQPQRW